MEIIQNTQKNVLCDESYIGIILRANDFHNEDGEITGASHGLRINMLKTDYVFDIEPFRQSSPIDFEIIDTLEGGSKITTMINDIYLVPNRYHKIDHYLVFDYVEWVADSVSVTKA